VRYRVEDASGRILHLESVDWMMAMVRATEAFGAVPTGLDCEHRGDGVVHVSDPGTGASWTITALPEGSDITPVPVGRMPTPLVAPPRREAMLPPRTRRYRTPVRKPLWSPESVPRQALANDAQDAPPPNLAERLEELARDIRSQPDGRSAAAEALRVVMVLVPCEAGSVLRGGRDDDAFEFLVVQGGAGDRLVGRRLPFGAGLAGAAYDAGVTILVDDVSTDPRHMAEIDRETGFQTRSILCVPVRSDAGFHGVIELLNPTRGSSFAPWHVDVAESLAAALAETVA
jgi:hypothetical protein